MIPFRPFFLFALLVAFAASSVHAQWNRAERGGPEPEERRETKEDRDDDEGRQGRRWQQGDRESGPMAAAFAARRLNRHIQGIRARVQEFHQQEEDLERLETVLAEKADEMPRPMLERRRRIADLRRELLTLERQVFLAEAGEQSVRAVEEMDRRIAEAKERADDARPEHQRVIEYLERLQTYFEGLRDSADNFEAFAEAATSAAMPWETAPQSGRDERLVKELNALRLRMERLERELESRPPFPPEGFEPRRRIAPDDAPRFPGVEPGAPDPPTRPYGRRLIPPEEDRP